MVKLAVGGRAYGCSRRPKLRVVLTRSIYLPKDFVLPARWLSGAEAVTPFERSVVLAPLNDRERLALRLVNPGPLAE